MERKRPELREFTADDGLRIRYRQWNTIKPKGCVVCLHGIRSHGAWYLESSEYLSRHGYCVLFPDRRGAGINRSVEEEGLRYRKWIADVERIVEIAGKEVPGAPVHLMGISWGGRLAVAVAAAGRVNLRSIILSTPGLISRVGYPAWRKIAVAAAFIFRTRHLFPVPLEDPALFTDDPDEQSYIEEDALGLRRVPARFLVENSRLERFAKAQVSAVRQPVLLLLAGRDLIIDNERVKKLFSRFQSADKIMKVYPNARHTLEFDLCRREYFEDIVNWLDKHP